MEFRSPLQQLSIKYPQSDDIPVNLIDQPIHTSFQSNSKFSPLREQFANEAAPHNIRGIQYRYGYIKKRRVVEYILNKKPVRMVYTDDRDRFLEDQMRGYPLRVKIPPLVAPTPIARRFREFALKWVVQRFFDALGYIAFDEPQILLGENEFVNPDLVLLPKTKLNAIGDGINDIKVISPDMDAIFVELKAFHESTIVGEKELLQCFNYSVHGEKALLITTGTLDLLNIFPFEKSLDDLIPLVTEKYHHLAKAVDMSLGQDAFDTRGIYRSAAEKVQKMKRYTKKWGAIRFDQLSNYDEIAHFLHSDVAFAICDAQQFKDILLKHNFAIEGSLFDAVQSYLLEDIIINPTLLYP
jgi:hypothetical protein